MFLQILRAFADTTIDLPNKNPNIASGSELRLILQIVFAIAGALALLMIVISGFRYIISAGEPQAMTKAKNGLVHAITGLAICILAEVIVSFVVSLI